MKKKNENLCCIVEKFTNGNENFDKLLGSQKLIFEKSGVGFEPTVKQKLFKNYFVKPSILFFALFVRKMVIYRLIVTLGGCVIWDL